MWRTQHITQVKSKPDFQTLRQCGYIIWEKIAQSFLVTELRLHWTEMTEANGQI